MRLLDLTESNVPASPVLAYHGSKQTDVVFEPSHIGDNSHTFGNYQSKRTGVFFSDNPEFSAMYGTVQQYRLNLTNTATDLLELAYRASMTLDAFHPDQRPLWIDVVGITRSSGREWQLFDDEIGDFFVPWLIEQGYDSAQFVEYNEDDDGQEHRSVTTVVFDPSKIQRVSAPVQEADLNEMPGWMHAYPKEDQKLPVQLFPDEIRSFKRIARIGDYDLYYSEKSKDAVVTPRGKPVTANVGYVAMHPYDRVGDSRQAAMFKNSLAIMDVFLAHELRGKGLGIAIYKALLDDGLTLVSATTVNPNSSAVWRKLSTDPSVNVWAMHPRGVQVYPLVVGPGQRLTPQVPPDGEDVTFERSVWFASTEYNPLKNQRPLGEAVQNYPKVMTADQMADYVGERHHTPEDLESGDILERIYSFSQYDLVYMRPEQIKRGQWHVDEDRRDDYIRQIKSGSPIPPIVIQELGRILIDGTHRHDAAVLAGVESIPVYVGRTVNAVPDDENPYAASGDEEEWEPDPEEYGFVETITESFFSDNLDILMPVVKTLMATAARPLIYKLWKKAPNAVLALAAIKRLHDQGDPQPLVTIEKQTTLDVPMQFLRRLAWEAGLHDIPGVPPASYKPGLMPMAVGAATSHLRTKTESVMTSLRPLPEDAMSDTITVLHVTKDENLPSIRQNGLEPRIGKNSADIGETDVGVHVFFDQDSMTDALMNWDMDWHEGDEDDDGPPLSVLTLEVPRAWVHSHWAQFNSGTGIVFEKIPPAMIKQVAEVY